MNIITRVYEIWKEVVWSLPSDFIIVATILVAGYCLYRVYKLAKEWGIVR